jgi:hypothetical protein
MLGFNEEIVTEEKRELIKPFARDFQGIVSLFSNLHFNIFKTELIMKWEGGVLVNGREIAIYNETVRDDFKPLRGETTKEEKIVVEVIEKIFNEVNFELLPSSLENWVNKNIQLKVFEKLGTFTNNPFGNKLKAFFDV